MQQEKEQLIKESEELKKQFDSEKEKFFKEKAELKKQLLKNLKKPINDSIEEKKDNEKEEMQKKIFNLENEIKNLKALKEKPKLDRAKSLSKQNEKDLEKENEYKKKKLLI